MKLCPKCDQAVAEGITTCPACGSEIGAGRSRIDDYHIEEVVHEGQASLLCRAVRGETGERVMIRLFTPQSGVDEEVADRLQRELQKLRELPESGFVRHQALHRSSDGLWYRVSEWVDAESWGTLLASGRLRDLATTLDIFRQTASTLGVLHGRGHIIPHLILNDIMVTPDDSGGFQVKIDYKLSRFLDPEMDRPGPMLQQLLDRHPDIVSQRPLDSRSDMWSLGKVFVELLAGDLDITDHEAAVDDLQVPEELKVLLRVMLADDPDLRPQSMDEIAEALSRIGHAGAVPSRTSRRRLSGKRPLWAALAVVLVAAIAPVAWYIGRQHRDVEGILEGYANRYAHSVAFVLSDYWLEADGEKIYRNASEGTAFLVDREGYLLTSRHVVCPWLEDGHLLFEADKLLQNDSVPMLGYRVYLWFEGQEAFNRAGNFLESPDITDFFFTENAFGTHNQPRLTLAGVVRPPVRTRQLIASPLKDDIAVLKIDEIPEGLSPLPLDAAFEPKKIPRLSRVIALGFPLGSRIQEDTVSASVVDGHVRRSFQNMLQIDSSLHGGNSGGPLIDVEGNVIGIVSAVAVDRSGGMFAGARPLGDIGMILPISGAAKLLAEIKAGGVKWNGVLDFTLGSTLDEIRKIAIAGRWADARELAESKLEGNVQAELLTACGMLAVCSGDAPAAKERFSQLLSMDPDDGRAKLMLYILDWLAGSAADNPYRLELTEAGWRSPDEFEGYLVRVLEGEIPLSSALKGWHGPVEKSWLSYAASLLHERSGNGREARAMLRHSALATRSDSWVLYLALAGLEQSNKRLQSKLRTERQWADYRAATAVFKKAREDSFAAIKELEKQLAPLLAELSTEELDIKRRLELLEKVRELAADNHEVEAALAFFHAIDEDWDAALENCRAFLASDGRMSASRMSLGLLEPAILNLRGAKEEAEKLLESYESTVRDPFFNSICDYLRGRVDAETLESEAGERPEDLLIANTFMGLWAEGEGDTELALAHYKEALGSYLDDWLEYDFARERIKRLRQPPEDTE
jgi:S1-C subfamily serine protease